MRVLHVLRATSLGGVESYVVDVLDQLRRRGVDAELALLTRRDRPLPEYRERLRERDIPVHAFTQFGHVNPHLLWWLYRLMRRRRPQVVHTHILDADLYGMLAAQATGVPVKVITRHGMEAFRRRAFFRGMNRQLWRMADAGIAVSQTVAAFAEEVEGAPRRKTRVILFGLEREGVSRETRVCLRNRLCRELDIEETRPILVAACRLVALKGVSYLLRAFAGVLERFPQAFLVIAGDGAERAQLQAEAKRLIPEENYRFLGWRDDVPGLLAACDLFSVPSQTEGFALANLEAMAQGLPVVATSISANAESVVDGETGILVPPRDVPALRDALLTLLRDPKLARQMGMKGRRRFEEHFQLERMADQVLSLYRELLSCTPSGQSGAGDTAALP